MSTEKEKKTTTETMTVTAALVERKTLKKRINREIKDGKYFGITIGVEKRPHDRSQPTEAAQASTIQSSVDKVYALITRYRSLVGALVVSNATTEITINGKAIKVAEAIEYKQSIAFDLLLASTIKEALVAHTMTVSSFQSRMDMDINTKINALYSGESVPEVNSEQFNQIAAPHRAQHEPLLHDPSGLVKSVPDLVSNIENFSDAVETALNVSNATTNITFEY